MAAGAVCVGLPSLSFLAPVVATAMLLPALRMRLLSSGGATASFVPDPLSPQFADLATALVKCAEKAAAGEGDSSLLLAPLFCDGGFIPYEITVRPGNGAVVVTCGEKTCRRSTDAPLRPRCQLPVRVSLQPTLLEVRGVSGEAVLRTPQPLVRLHPGRPRHISAAGLAYRFYLVALFALCLACGRTLETEGAPLVAFAFLPALLVRAAAFRARVFAFLRNQLWFARRLVVRFCPNKRRE